MATARDDEPVEISTRNPTCFLFLVDQSGSMNEPFGRDSSKKKKDGVADALNRLLQTLVFRCAKGETILDRYYIGVIGYGDQAATAWGGKLAGRGLVPVSEIGCNPLRIVTRTKKMDDGVGGLIEQKVQFPVWFEAVAAGQTHMCEALELARKSVAEFVTNCPKCFSPIVVNISDGAASDGDPEPGAAAIRALASVGGNVLLFNIHISVHNEEPILFPASEAMLPENKNAHLLYRMSSPLPPEMIRQARSMEFKIADGARGFAFNADLVALIQFLDIGTRVDRVP